MFYIKVFYFINTYINTRDKQGIHAYIVRKVKKSCASFETECINNQPPKVNMRQRPIAGWPPTQKINFNGTANITKYLCKSYSFIS